MEKFVVDLSKLLSEKEEVELEEVAKLATKHKLAADSEPWAEEPGEDGVGPGRSVCNFIDQQARRYFGAMCQSKHQTLSSLVHHPSPKDRCQQAPVQNLRPVVTLRLLDGPNDRIETEDIETICVTVRNPWSNVTFDCFDLGYHFLFNQSGFPKPTPGGTPSSVLAPPHKLCFGTIGPCQSVQRELTLINRDTVEGLHLLAFLYCYKATIQQFGVDAFRLDYVKS